MKNCTPLWREAHFQVKMYKTPQLQTTFGSCDVEKVHAIVAQRCAKHISKSKCIQSTRGADHFWQLRCRKSARRCGAKAHFEVNMYKTLGFRTSFGGSDVFSLRFTTLHYSTLPSATLHDITLHSTTQQLQLRMHNYTPLH